MKQKSLFSKYVYNFTITYVKFTRASRFYQYVEKYIANFLNDSKSIAKYCIRRKDLENHWWFRFINFVKTVGRTFTAFFMI